MGSVLMPASCSNASSAAMPAIYESPQPVITTRFTDRHSLWFSSSRAAASSRSNSLRIRPGKLSTWAIIVADVIVVSILLSLQ